MDSAGCRLRELLSFSPMAVTVEHVAERLRAEGCARDAAAEARTRGLTSKLDAAADLLRAAGAARVWLFGSLALGNARLESDVDLAVEKLPRARYFDLLSALMALFETRVDLVAMEDAPQALRERILGTGRIL